MRLLCSIYASSKNHMLLYASQQIFCNLIYTYDSKKRPLYVKQLTPLTPSPQGSTVYDSHIFIVSIRLGDNMNSNSMRDVSYTDQN